SDIFSPFWVSGGIGSVWSIGAGGGAIAAAKILALEDPDILDRVRKHQAYKKREVEEADKELRGMRG
ncbi:hypothetical protein J7L27_03845, partial [Candidatus Bathyarchaeota archaeon]|nr:hypothetical protein [Candidatus Bathyarchaeota archaeon]